MTEFLITAVLLFALLAAGAPVFVALGLASLAYFLAEGLPPAAAAHTMINGVNSFPLISIPFFILMGHLMNSAGFTDRIFAFARALIGWAPGGLGHVNVGASVLFAGMSGAAVADAGGLGAIEIRAMRDAGYDRGFAVGLTAASSTIGPIIPPSLPLIIYGVIAEVSIGQLFLAGLIPGVLMAVALMAMVHTTAVRAGFRRDVGFSINRLFAAARAAMLPLLTPALVVGGIVLGILTPTEAAVAAVLFTLLVGVLVFRTLSALEILRAVQATIHTTASVLMIVASAALFAWVLTANQLAGGLAAAILAVSTDSTPVLLMIMALVFAVGFFLETIAAITILVPVILPVSQTVGIDPIHLGIVLVLNLMLGLLTPPVGVVLYVLAKVARVPFEECARATIPFLLPLVLVLLLVVLVPELALWLPNTFAS
ncbi:MAG: TRAP transporter large permease [Pseudomonadota bacterium]